MTSSQPDELRVDQTTNDCSRAGQPASDTPRAAHASAHATKNAFPKSARLHSSIDFDDLFHRGKVLADQTLVIHARRVRLSGSTGARGRLGISISKRVGNAPCRNRWKRLIREAYRQLYSRSQALCQLDIVVRPRRGAVPSFQAIDRSLAQLSSRLAKQLARHVTGSSVAEKGDRDD